MKKFSIIIPSGRPEHTMNLIRDLENQEYSLKDVEVIIIGGNGLEDLKKIPNAKELPIKLIEQEKDTGASSARNRGIDSSEGEFLIFLDDDVRLEENFLEKCEEYSSKYSSFCFRVKGPKSTFLGKIITGKVFSSLGVMTGGFETEKEDIIEVSHFPGCCFIVSKELVGSTRFDDYFEKGNGYLDDTDFTYSLKEKNNSLKYIPEYSIKHEMKKGGYRVQEYSKWLYYFWNHKAYFVKKHSGENFLWLAFLFSFLESLYISLIKGGTFLKELVNGWEDGWREKHNY